MQKTSSVLFILVTTGACAVEPRLLEPSRWGGPDLGLLVGDTTATVLFDCAEGRIPGPIRLDASGQFEARGTLGRTVGPGDLMPARYMGEIAGRRLTLRAVVTDTLDPAQSFTLGPFTARRDVEPQVAFCE